MTKMDKQDWPGAIKLFEQIERTEPGYRDANNLLKQAQAEIERQAFFAALVVKGKEQLSERKWAEAISFFQQALASNPGNVEAQELLAEAEKGQEAAEAELQIKQEQEQREHEAAAQRQAQLAKLYEQANAKMAEKDWSGAGRLFEQIARTEPGYRDVKNLLELARIHQDRQDKFDSLLAKGKECLEKREWRRATRNLEQALGLAPGDGEAQSLLAEAEKGKQANDLFDTALRHLRVEEWPEAIANFKAVLELEPDHKEARVQLAEAEIKLARQEEEKAKKLAESEKPVSRLAKPVLFPEEIKPSKPGSVPEKIQPSKPGSLPEEIKPGKKPRDLPK
jgi:outer membrane protein assembly factor BamD (BamD/ComL family)